MGKTGIPASAPRGAVMASNSAAPAAGAVALTFPAWADFLVPAHQLILAFLGLVVLILTIRKTLLDIKIKRATLRAIAADPEKAAESAAGEGAKE